MLRICKFKVCDKKPKIWLRDGALAPQNLVLSASILFAPQPTFSLVPSLMPSVQSVRNLLLERISNKVFEMGHLDKDWKIESFDVVLTKKFPERWLLSHHKAPHFYALLTSSQIAPSFGSSTNGNNSSQLHPTGGWQLERAAKEFESSGIQVLRARDAVNPNGVPFSFFDLKTRPRSTDPILRHFQSESFLRQNVFRFKSKLLALTCVGERGNLTEHLSLCRELIAGIKVP